MRATGIFLGTSCRLLPLIRLDQPVAVAARRWLRRAQQEGVGGYRKNLQHKYRDVKLVKKVKAVMVVSWALHTGGFSDFTSRPPVEARPTSTSNLLHYSVKGISAVYQALRNPSIYPQRPSYELP